MTVLLSQEEVPRDNLYVLEGYLASIIPCQAIRCALDGVERLKPDGELREELKSKFEELLSDKVGSKQQHNCYRG